MAKRVRLISGLILFTFFSLSFAQSVVWTCVLGGFGRRASLVFVVLVDGRWHHVLGGFDGCPPHVWFVCSLQAKHPQDEHDRHGPSLPWIGDLSLLFGHLLGNVIGPMMTGVGQTYASILTLFWVLNPVLGLQQVIVTVVTWIHGCMGLVIWMRIQSMVDPRSGFIYPLVVAVPLLALLGMVEAGKEVIELNKDPISQSRHGQVGPDRHHRGYPGRVSADRSMGLFRDPRRRSAGPAFSRQERIVRR